MMFGKKSLMALVVLVFTLSFAVFCFAAEDTAGIISKIQDKQITIQDAAGQDKKIEISDPDTLKNLKVGDKIAMQDGMLIKKVAPFSETK